MDRRAQTSNGIASASAAASPAGFVGGTRLFGMQGQRPTLPPASPRAAPAVSRNVQRGHRVRAATMAREHLTNETIRLKDIEFLSSLSRNWAPLQQQERTSRPQPKQRRPQIIAPPEEKLADTKTENPADFHHPSQGWKLMPHHPSKQELWQAIRLEAWRDAASEPALASFLYSTILSHSSLEKTLAFLLSNKLSNKSTLLEGVQLMGLFQSVYEDDADIMDSAMADILAVKDRDPACDRYSQALLYFKGYQAMQTHRVAHRLWRTGRQSLAMALQSRASELFHVDIHPGAQIGKGVLLDHGTGVVIGETAVVGDNVSMLHRVSLGGSGTGRGFKRHPTIGHGVLLGAGVSVLGPVTIGAGSKVGAGSVVNSDIPMHCVAVGVPARVVKRDLLKEPVSSMDQCMDFIMDYVI